MKTPSKLLLAVVLVLFNTIAQAADYKIDTKDMHAFVHFRIQHLGYSWLYGSFNDFSGDFSFDSNDLSSAKASIVINTASLDTNHAERDKHLRSDDFFDVKKFPQIKFVSTGFNPSVNNEGILHGNLTIHGVTRSVSLQVQQIGEGMDPWGGYRAGFFATTTLNRSDFGVDKNLGPASEKVEITLSIEGIRQ